MWITTTWPWAKGRSRWGGNHNHEEPRRTLGEWVESFFQMKITWRTAAWETCINLHRFESIYIHNTINIYKYIRDINIDIGWASFGGMFLICPLRFCLCFFYITYINIASVSWKKGRNRAAEVGVGIQRGALGLELSFRKFTTKSVFREVPQKSSYKITTGDATKYSPHAIMVCQHLRDSGGWQGETETWRHGDMGIAMWNNFHSFQAVLEKRLDAYAVESSTQTNIFERPRKNMKKHET